MLKAVILNGSLKKSAETSNTDALIEKTVDIFDRNNVKSDVIRLADHQIAFGVTEDEGNGDKWPFILDKIRVAEILIIGTPIWLGEKSSISTMAMERLYGASSLTNERGQSIYYNKVAGVVVTGNEDGAKTAARSILYGLSHIGFTIPPHADTYWVGEAGPGASFIEADGWQNEFTRQHTEMMSYNLIHFARLLQEHPIPAEGNMQEE